MCGAGPVGFAGGRSNRRAKEETENRQKFWKSSCWLAFASLVAVSGASWSRVRQQPMAAPQKAPAGLAASAGFCGPPSGFLWQGRPVWLRSCCCRDAGGTSLSAGASRNNSNHSDGGSADSHWRRVREPKPSEQTQRMRGADALGQRNQEPEADIATPGKAGEWARKLQPQASDGSGNNGNCESAAESTTTTATTTSTPTPTTDNEKQAGGQRCCGAACCQLLLSLVSPGSYSSWLCLISGRVCTPIADTVNRSASARTLTGKPKPTGKLAVGLSNPQQYQLRHS